MDVVIARLAAAVKHSRFFSKRETADEPSLAKVLDLLAKKYPDSVTPEEMRSTLNGGNIQTTITRLNNRLEECFLLDRSLWPTQTRLLVGHPKRNYALRSGPLSEKLSPTLRFWFGQCLRLPNPPDMDQDSTEAARTFITFSEPLFFFSKNLRCYLRLLDLNREGLLDEEDIDKLASDARSRIREAIPGSALTSPIDEFITKLDFVPVRSYIPAGDSNAAVRIRDWFRKTKTIRQDIQFKEGLHVAHDDFSKSNLIILASRSTNSLLARFQKMPNELRIRLTETGITLGKEPLDDRSDRQGFHFVRVVVTNWTFDTQNVHTYIASNHSRAIEAVAALLVQDNATLDTISSALLDGEGQIPQRFQLAFEVELQFNESQANEPRLLTELDGKAVFYDDAGKPR